MRVASQLTGLSTLVIRAWENRYNAISPERSEGKHRLYTDNDIRRLKLLRDAVYWGMKISKASLLDNDELEKIIYTRRNEVPLLKKGNNPTLIENCFSAIRNLDAQKLEELMTQYSIEEGVLKVIDFLVVPLMNEIREGWHEGQWRIFHEHFTSAVIRSFIGNQILTYRSEESQKTVIVATPVGQIHELGAAAVALSVVSAGFHALYLGSNIPAEEILKSAEDSQADLVIMSIVFPQSTAKAKSEISTLKKYLPSTCPLLLGGVSAKSYLDEYDDSSLENLQDLHQWLLNFRLNTFKAESTKK